MKRLNLITAFSSIDVKWKKDKIYAQYQKLNNFYNEFLLTQEGQSLIKLFDNKINTEGYMVTPIKKIDFIIWQTR